MRLRHPWTLWYERTTTRQTRRSKASRQMKSFSVASSERRSIPSTAQQQPALSSYQAAFKEQFDKRHGTKPRDFRKGQGVSVELANGKRVSGKVVGFHGRSMLWVVVQGKKLVRHMDQVWKRIAETASPSDAEEAYVAPQGQTPAEEQPKARAADTADQPFSESTRRQGIPRKCKIRVDYRTLTR